MVGKDVAVVFNVLAQFGFAGVFEPRAQFVEHGLQGQLLGGVCTFVPERNVCRMPSLHAQANANELRLHGVQRGGFGIDGGERGGIDGG